MRKRLPSVADQVRPARRRNVGRRRPRAELLRRPQERQRQLRNVRQSLQLEDSIVRQWVLHQRGLTTITLRRMSALCSTDTVFVSPGQRGKSPDSHPEHCSQRRRCRHVMNRTCKLPGILVTASVQCSGLAIAPTSSVSLWAPRRPTAHPTPLPRSAAAASLSPSEPPIVSTPQSDVADAEYGECDTLRICPV